MPDKFIPGPIGEDRYVREAISMHTSKILDSCKDKDCVEDVQVYLTCSSQEILERASSVKACSAELLNATIDVQPIGFNKGFYTVDIHYFYRISADACVGTVRPVEIVGLATFDKRCILYGGECGAKTFTSAAVNADQILSCAEANLPLAVVEAVDPLILSMKVVNYCDCSCNVSCCGEVPTAIGACFAEDLVMNSQTRRLVVSLGQFSIVRLERGANVLAPIYDYCMPEKECDGGCDFPQEDPCEVFRQVKFPVEEFCSSNGRSGDSCDNRPCCCCD